MGKTPAPTKCVLDMTLNTDGEVPVILEHPFIAIARRSTLAWSGSGRQGPINELSRTKLHTFAKLNLLKYNCFGI